MARHEDGGGVSALVRHTAGMAELAIDAGHPDRKHNEILPYPDANFGETLDCRYQKGLFFNSIYFSIDLIDFYLRR